MAVMKDVAKLAGVSPSAVSKYLNYPEKMSEEYKTRIQKAITELNYIPNNIARSMRTGKTNKIVLIIPELTNPYYSEIYNAVRTSCALKGYTPIVYTTEENTDILNAFLSNFNSLNADGILMAFVDEDEIMQKVDEIENQIPITLLSWNIDNDKFNSVDVDLYDGINKATKHLIDIGHKKIGYISGISSSRISKEKYRGFEKAMLDSGLPIAQEYTASGKYRFATGFNATRKFMQLPDPPTAIVGANDILAIGAIKYLINNGYNVPKDCAVIGFDGISLSKIYDPSISTVAQPISEMGVKAVDLLIDSIEKPTKNHTQIIFPTKLVVRRSTDENAPLILDI